MKTALERLLVWTVVILAILSNLPTPDHKAAVIREANGKTVQIIVRYESGRSLGSGVIVSKDGYILTCRHMFLHGQPKTIFVKLANGSAYPASINKISARTDLALLRLVKRNIKFTDRQVAEVANPKYIRQGQEMFMVGCPLGMMFTVTHGIISALHRDIADDLGENFLQVDAASNPGNSGGPLFNYNGQIIGICSFGLSANPFFLVPSGVNFAVEATQLKQFLREIK